MRLSPISGILALLVVTNVAAQSTTIPAGAATLGYTKRLIDEQPVAADIAPGRSGQFKWFSGQWWSHNSPPLDRYATVHGALALRLGGNLVSAPLDFSPGLLPLISGDKGFYVEFDVQLSDNDSDHWPALWLMPVEHSGSKGDHYPGDRAGFERWMELDVDEGGYGSGHTGTSHSWTGVFPHYRHQMNQNNVSHAPLDRSRQHSFGASYDPTHDRVTWWVDGAIQMSAESPHVPAVAAKQHFYLIISAQSHGAQKPYRMLVRGVRVFVPPD